MSGKRIFWLTFAFSCIILLYSDISYSQPGSLEISKYLINFSPWKLIKYEKGVGEGKFAEVFPKPNTLVFKEDSTAISSKENATYYSLWHVDEKRKLLFLRDNGQETEGVFSILSVNEKLLFFQSLEPSEGNIRLTFIPKVR